MDCIYIMKSPLKTKQFCLEELNHFSVYPQIFPTFLMDAVLNALYFMLHNVKNLFHL